MDNNINDKVKLATLAAFISNFIFGLSFMASRIVLEHTTSSMMLTLRFAASVLIMLLLAVTGIVTLDFRGKNVKSLMLLGLFHPVIYFIGEANGIRLTNSSFAGIMISLIPVVTAIGSGFTLYSRSMADEYTPFERTFVMMCMGLVFFTAVTLVREGSGFIPLFIEAATDKYVLLPIIYLSFISSVLAFVLQNYSVTYLDASKVTVFSNIIPVVSVVAGVLVLGEPFTAVYLIGIILILVGVYKVNTVTKRI